jgi:hypothetical protein
MHSELLIRLTIALALVGCASGPRPAKPEPVSDAHGALDPCVKDGLEKLETQSEASAKFAAELSVAIKEATGAAKAEYLDALRNKLTVNFRTGGNAPSNCELLNGTIRCALARSQSHAVDLLVPVLNASCIHSPPAPTPKPRVSDEECRRRCGELCKRHQGEAAAVVGHFCSDSGDGRKACLNGDPGVDYPRCNDAAFLNQ